MDDIFRFSTLWKLKKWIKLLKIGLKYYTIWTVRQDFIPFLNRFDVFSPEISEVIGRHSLIDAVDVLTGGWGGRIDIDRSINLYPKN